MSRFSALRRSIALHGVLGVLVVGCHRDVASATPPCASCESASPSGECAPSVPPPSALHDAPGGSLPAAIRDSATAAGPDAGEGGDPCQAAMSQLEMNQCWGNLAKRSQAEVKRLAIAIERLLEARSDRTNVDRQRAAQSEWEQYRDRQCELEQQRFAGGSAAGMVLNQCRYRLQRHRLTELAAIQDDWTNR